ncbi:hypothetical protein OR1_01630 [Geobacter sp. OR-1]|nr:hypothetical protein OR1_01630 [Geobacter sp. OR-1]
MTMKSQCFWDNRTDLMKQFTVTWTPTLLVLDQTGKEHHRMVGYVPAEDLLGQLKLGKAKMHFNRFRFAEALTAFAEVIDNHPAAGAAAEAIFFHGVAGYWQSHDPKRLRMAYDTLLVKFPNDEWTRRAAPYAAIPL